jgi:hypothetical protein
MIFYYILNDDNRLAFFSVTKEGSFLEDSIVQEIDLPETTQIIIGEHGIVDNQLVYLGTKENNNKELEINNKKKLISDLASYLFLTDYKVIKCYEASLLNEEMPYNLQELLAQRKAWREEINAIEFEISMLG